MAPIMYHIPLLGPSLPAHSQESVAEFRRRVPSITSAGFLEKIQEVNGEGGGPDLHDEGFCSGIVG